MDSHLEKVALRFHRRLLRYHRIGMAFDIAEGAFCAALYHAVCVGFETFAVAYHKQVLSRKGDTHGDK